MREGTYLSSEMVHIKRISNEIHTHPPLLAYCYVLLYDDALHK